MNELNILESIENVSGKNEKAQILKDNKDNQRLGELLNAGLNFFRKFHIHKFEVVHEVNEDEFDLHDEFISLLAKLEQRQVTGHTAKVEVETFFRLCNAKQQKWYSRVLRKDLKIGVSVKTAAKFFDIPTFDVMLATDGKKCKKLNQIIESGVYASPKLDGYRCLAVVTHDGSVTLYSRNGSIYNNFPTIEESLLNTFKNVDIVLDGEIMSDDFQSMQQSAFASTRGTTVGDVKFHVFDHIPFKEWQTGQFDTKKSLRYLCLEAIAPVFPSNIVLVDQEKVDSVDRVLQLEKEYMELGYEGVMVVPDVPYYKGRKSNKLMKFKTMLSQDCIIVGHYLGDVGTRLEGKLGGFTVKQENGEICKVGTGFSDKDREQYVLAPDTWYNKCMEIKYQELTNDGIMRFPVFMRWRFEKNAL